MVKLTPELIAADLNVPELFCLSSKTDWRAAGITHATAQRMMVRGLIQRERTGTGLVLTPQGRAVFAALVLDG